MTSDFPELNPPQRVLLGPGPSNPYPEVTAALVRPVLGHLDPEFILVMERIKELLRIVFRTKNEITFPASGTGSAGMEMVLSNLIEEGDEVVIGVAGIFGERFVDCAQRLGARVTRVDSPWGRIVEPAQIGAALKKLRRPALVALVHAETSTGVYQPVEEIAQLAHEHGALMVLDTVTSLGCVAVDIDAWQIDACYSCTQKGLSAPPGLAPVTLSARAMEVVRQRRTKCPSWYLDLAMIEQYWGGARLYHHTAPITMNYALYEALRLVVEEGLEARFRRHALNAQALHAGLEAMGLQLVAQEGYRLPQLSTVAVPAGADEATVRDRLLREFNIEVGAGLGPFKGRVWRIGLMGESARRENVTLVLAALETILGSMGVETARGRALEAAAAVYSANHGDS